VQARQGAAIFCAGSVLCVRDQTKKRRNVALCHRSQYKQTTKKKAKCKQGKARRCFVQGAYCAYVTKQKSGATEHCAADSFFF